MRLTEAERRELAYVFHGAQWLSPERAAAVERILTARIADMEARIRALAEEWGDEDELIEHVGACQDYGCKTCVVAACATDLRALLDAAPAGGAE